MGWFDIDLKVWDTPLKLENWDKTVTLLMAISTLFLLLSIISVGGDILVILQQQTYIVLLAFMLVFSWASFSMKPKVQSSFGNPSNVGMGVILGIVVAAIMVLMSTLACKSSGQCVGALNVLAVPAATMISSVALISLAYQAFIIPFAEEKFFGQTLPYVLKESTGSSLVGIFGASIIFGIFHLITYGVSINLFVTIAFRFIAIYGNQIMKTSSFGMTAHYINNIVKVFKIIV